MSEYLDDVIKEVISVADQVKSLASQIQEANMVNQTAMNNGSDPFVHSMTIFALACFVGYYVVWKVTPSLHTPLMAITNAISGIIIIGAMLGASSGELSSSSFLSLVAVFFAAINIFGGFIVTQRMVAMFKIK